MKFPFKRTFRLLCLVLFLNQAYKCLQEYNHQEANTKEYHAKQESYLRPHICLGVPNFEFKSDKLDKSDYIKYVEGHWNFYNTSEEDFFNFISPQIEDLLKYIRIYYVKNNKEEKLKFKTKIEWENNFDIIRKDSYDMLKVFCLDVR